MCTVFCCLIVLQLFDYFFVFFSVCCECGYCLKNKTSSGGIVSMEWDFFCVSFEFCLFLLLVWAIACVLKLDTCCDCSWLCSVFVSQRYLNLTGLLLCGLEKFHAPASSARETPQLNIVLFYVALSLMLHMSQIKTKCARPVRPAHKRKATTAVTCCGAVAKVSGRPPDGSGQDRLVGWMVSSWS